ncbi:MAG: MlaD family protein [Halothiobacillaceae bacterium]
MESKVNYSIIGLFVLLLLAAAMATAWWLYTGGSSRQYNSYLVFATDSVTGLTTDSRVYYQGVDVGYVESIRIDRDNPENIRIQLQIDQTVPIQTDIRARLQLQGVTGLSVLNLRGGASGEPLTATEGQCCPVIPYEPSLLSQLEGGVSDTMVRFLEVSERLDRLLLHDDNLDAIVRTIRQLDEVTATLAAERNQMSALLRNAARTAENTASLTEKGDRLMAQAESTITSLNQAIGKVSGAMDTFEATANRIGVATDATVGFSQAGEQAAREISRQTIPDISVFIRDLRELTRRLSDFTSNLDQSPTRAFFGGTERPPGPGEGTP